MNITISDPTPAPEMPVMWAVAYKSAVHERWILNSWSTIENAARADHASKPGSRLITIDPNAQSFEPGPTEWVDSEGWSCSVVTTSAGTTVRVRSLSTRTDIGHLIRALVTAWYAAKEGT